MYKKKKKSKWWLVLLILLIAAAGVAYWKYDMVTKANEESEENALDELARGQEYIYVRITSILGNEMTATVYEDDRETGKQQTWTIPVGTDVVTKLGTTTSFSRLASGDYIRMLMQEDGGDEVILKIWIMN